MKSICGYIVAAAGSIIAGQQSFLNNAGVPIPSSSLSNSSSRDQSHTEDVANGCFEEVSSSARAQEWTKHSQSESTEGNLPATVTDNGWTAPLKASLTDSSTSVSTATADDDYDGHNGVFTGMLRLYPVPKTSMRKR